MRGSSRRAPDAPSPLELLIGERAWPSAGSRTGSRSCRCRGRARRARAASSSPGRARSSRPTSSATSVIQRAWDDVYSSLASSAFASASTVETNVRSRLSTCSALSIASFAWCARPASSRNRRSSSSRSADQSPTTLRSGCDDGAIRLIRRTPINARRSSLLVRERLGAVRATPDGSSRPVTSLRRRTGIRRADGETSRPAARRPRLNPERTLRRSEHACGHLDAPRERARPTTRRSPSSRLASSSAFATSAASSCLPVQAGLLERHRSLRG